MQLCIIVVLFLHLTDFQGWTIYIAACKSESWSCNRNSSTDCESSVWFWFPIGCEWLTCMFIDFNDKIDCNQFTVFAIMTTSILIITIASNMVTGYAMYVFRALFGLRGCKKRPAPFPGRMLYKAIKPDSVCFIS